MRQEQLSDIGNTRYQALSSLRKKHAAGTSIARNAGVEVASKAKAAASFHVNGGEDDDDNDPAYGEKPKKRGRGPGKKSKAAVKVTKEELDKDEENEDVVKIEHLDDDEEVDQPAPKRARKDPATPKSKLSGRQAQIATPQPTPADEKAMEEVEGAFGGGAETQLVDVGADFDTVEQENQYHDALQAERENQRQHDHNEIQKQLAMEMAMINGAQLVGEDDLSVFDESWVA